MLKYHRSGTRFAQSINAQVLTRFEIFVYQGIDILHRMKEDLKYRIRPAMDFYRPFMQNFSCLEQGLQFR